jgi:hypothetical protein
MPTYPFKSFPVNIDARFWSSRPASGAVTNDPNDGWKTFDLPDGYYGGVGINSTDDP